MMTASLVARPHRGHSSLARRRGNLPLDGSDSSVASAVVTERAFDAGLKSRRLSPGMTERGKGALPQVNRPGVRVFCLDAADRVLLFHYRDPTDGHFIWEPPGGGIDEGESAIDAAQRELMEETGLSGTFTDGPIAHVQRDCVWAGRHLVIVEPFFVIRPVDTRVSLLGLSPAERAALRGYRWWSLDEILKESPYVEPPELPSLLARYLGRSG